MLNRKKIMMISFMILSVFIFSACSLNTSNILEEKSNQEILVEDTQLQVNNLINHDWIWVQTNLLNEIIKPEQKNAFVINFNEDLSLNGLTDCNNFFGTYEVDNSNIEFGPVASTRMFCENSQENQFTSYFDKFESFYFSENGNLHINLKNNEGQIEFQEKLIIHQPLESEKISSPLEIKGEARGTWFFEGSFMVLLTNWDGLIIAEGVAQMDASEETWMTEDMVDFNANLEYENPALSGSEIDHFSRRGSLIFKRANPSGLAENDEAIEFVVNFE